VDRSALAWNGRRKSSVVSRIFQVRTISPRRYRIDKFHALNNHAGVAELADAQDLKSWVPQGACGFDARPRHTKESMTIAQFELLTMCAVLNRQKGVLAGNCSQIRQRPTHRLVMALWAAVPGGRRGSLKP
jgi:hypothetical protein